MPQFSHVFVVVEENHSYKDVIGNPEMPYLNELARRYGLATNYFANTHPSIGNYFMLTTGEIVTNDNGFSGTVSDDNVVRRLVAAGRSWKCYAQSLPEAGYVGPSRPPYVRRHNPFVYMTDVLDDAAQRGNVVPMHRLSRDIASGNLPDYGFIVPDVKHDAHDGSLRTADEWLKNNIDPLITSKAFRDGGLLVITWDEADSLDIAHGGGHVATVIVSSRARRDFRSAVFYQHQSTLALTLSALGISAIPGAGANAPSMAPFFQ